MNESIQDKTRDNNDVEVYDSISQVDNKKIIKED